MRTNLEFRAMRRPYLLDALEIHCFARTASGDIAVFKPAEMTFLKTEEEKYSDHPPVLTIQSGEAQNLMDELWRAGIRPTEGAGSVGQLSAVQAHLEDMRTLVFRTPAA